MKVRVKFTKEGMMKYIGHLDLMRYFQKAFRRSGIDIAYSQGFSPHQLISFAAPLGLGLTSVGEYMDLMMNSSGSSKHMLTVLNAEMTQGVRLLSWHRIDDETRHSNAMAILAAADYRITFSEAVDDSPEVRSRLIEFLTRGEILAQKKTKNGTKQTDIRPLIYTAEVFADSILLRLATGSTQNLKPEAVMEAFFSEEGINWNPWDLSICRCEMYAAGSGGGLVTLDDLGYDILCGDMIS